MQFRSTDEKKPAPFLRLEAIEKRFGGVRALRGADFEIATRGTVQGLTGQNGSGKSTILSVLSGQIRPDAGRILIDGEETVFHTPADAIAKGIAMVAQETALAPDLSIAENIFLGNRLARSALGIDWNRTRAAAVEALGRLELDYDPTWRVRRLRPDQCQMVEIARALSLDARVLILDEPTSSLTDDEVQSLFAAVNRLKEQGVCTVFVSHRINELFELTDQITVLRDGLTAASEATADFTPNSLVTAMVGTAAEEIAEAPAGVEREKGGEPLLEVRDLQVPGVLTDINLSVHPGEIVGIAGLVGAGRSELLEAIFGIRANGGGSIRVAGEPFEPRNPRAAIARQMGFLPPDRKVQGLVLRRPIVENLNLVKTVFARRLGRPSRRASLATFEELRESMSIRANSPNALASSLSGGNQQKVALGKWLAARPSVLLLDEPTRGVDVAAKAEIHNLLREAAGEGMGLVVSSSENTELLELCDRVVVVFRGQITGILNSDQATEALIAQYAGGHV